MEKIEEQQKISENNEEEEEHLRIIGNKLWKNVSNM